MKIGFLQNKNIRMLKYSSYEDAFNNFNWDQAWELFDGDRENFNIAHECVDRHPAQQKALRIKFADGHYEEYDFGQLSRASSQFANALEKMDVGPQEPVAIMLDPSFEFYVSLFGILKRGAIVVPCFPQFGAESLEFRLNDSKVKTLIIGDDLRDKVPSWNNLITITNGSEFDDFIGGMPDTYMPNTIPKDISVYQYTSGTSKQYPEAIKQYHRSIVTLMPAAIFGRGFRPGDRYFCPSHPAWGHGLWHGTFCPLALGIAVGAYSGRFDIGTFLEGLEQMEINSLGAAPTVFRMIKNFRSLNKYNLKIKKMHYTGEPMDTGTFKFFQDKFGVPPYSGYGSTEVGSVIYQYAGFKNWIVKPGSLGKPLPGIEATILDRDGVEVTRGSIGEIAVKRRGKWIRTKDVAVIDKDGIYWHKSRIDDVIISSGWTISPTEIEDVLRGHSAVNEVVVVGIPNPERGQIVKAFIEAIEPETEQLKEDLQNLVREKLSRHEYPREIQFVKSFPRTESGKIKRAQVKQWKN